MTKRAVAHLIRIIYSLALVATSLSVAILISHTADEEFSGNCFIDSVAVRSSVCDMECEASVDPSATCAYGIGQCVNSSGTRSCSVPCYTLTTGTKSRCDYLIASHIISLVVASVIFGASLWLYRRVPMDNTPVTWRKPLAIAGTAFLLFILTLVAAALLTQGRRNMCNSLEATGNSCAGTSVRGTLFVHHFPPPHFQRNMLVAVVLAWIGAALWLSIFINSLIHFYVLRREQVHQLPSHGVDVRQTRTNSQTKLDPAAARVPYEGF